MQQQGLVPEQLPEPLVQMLGHYLARQRWYAGAEEPSSVTVQASGVLAGTGAEGRLLWALAEAGGSQYQLVIAERPEADAADRVRGHEEALVGVADGKCYYDATVDSEMAVALLSTASEGGEKAQRGRPLSVEQSNTSVVYDDRLILKVFRRLSDGPGPDVDVTSALAGTGFSHVAQPLVRWQAQGRDLAFGQQYLAGGTDGWALALTSLRDFYGARGDASDPCHPGLSGGDFAAEAARLGQMTGEMHMAMAEAFGISDELAGWWDELVAGLGSEVGRLVPELASTAAPLLDRLGAVGHPGPAVRAHGDYHLGQVMRTDSGWYVLDFEGEPNRSFDERLRPTSPMKDVTGMLRSLHYAAHFAMDERCEDEPQALRPLADAWEDRNRKAFLQGYYDCKGIDELLPAASEDREAVRVAFELEKALYELSYERDFRPHWVGIPEAGLRRLLTQPLEDLLAVPGPPRLPDDLEVPDDQELS